MEGQERRIFPRKNFKTQIVFEDEYGDGIFYLYSTDISLGGIFLETDVPLKMGSLMFLSLIIPEHKRPLHLTGEVVRIIEMGENAKSGIGIRWMGMNERTLSDLKNFLAE